MRHIGFVLIVAVLIPLGAFAEFKAGAGVRVITPDPLLPISGGVGTPVPVEGKKGDLFARALVMENAGERVAIVGVDNLGMPGPLLDKARALIKGVPPEHVIIGVTHTHSAPDAYGFPDGEGGHTADEAYLEFMVEEIAASVNEAVEKLQPATLKIATGEAADRISWNAYAEALYDPRCHVLQAVAENGENIATLVNFATHPEVLGPKRKTLSPDICGPFYERVEAQAGGVAIFMNSAQGGMVTADNRIPGTDDETYAWEECIRIGNLLADEALRIISNAAFQEDPKVEVLCHDVEFPVDSELMRGLVSMSPIMEMSEDNTVTTKMCLVEVGNAQMLTIPGEAMPNIGSYLKRKMPTEHPFLLGLTNDAFGYILTKEDFEAFKRYDYISRTSLGERTGDVLVDAAMKLIAEAGE